MESVVVNDVTPNSHCVRRRMRLGILRHSTHKDWAETHLQSVTQWNCLCEYNYSLPIYFSFCMCDTHFWSAMTLVCACVDVLGVDLG